MTTMKPRSHANLAIRSMGKLGIALPSKVGMAELPHNLPDLSSTHLTQLMNRFSSYLAYVKAQLALAEIRHADFEDRYNKSYAIKYTLLQSNNDGATVTSMRQQVELSLLKSKRKVSVAKAKYTLLLAVHDGSFQGYTLLSRELTRRTSSFDRGTDT